MVDVNRTLRTALINLEREKSRLERQIEAIRAALNTAAPGPARAAGRRRGRRKPMSAAARAAVSRRMKAYWAKRRGSKGRGKK